MNYSLQAYEDVINEILESGYKIKCMPKVGDVVDPHERACYLRHDVDISLDAAVEVAALEESLGVSSTYYIMADSPFYNPLSFHDNLNLYSIAGKGHDFGAHIILDDEHDLDSHKDLITWFVDRVGGVVSRKIDRVSFHVPSENVLWKNLDDAGIRSAYEEFWAGRYISDSTRRFNLGWLRRLLNGGGAFQALFHPACWAYPGKTMSEVYDAYLLNQKESISSVTRNFFKGKYVYDGEGA